ncbi:hypothetical protein MASR1M45_02590 [Candidatus Kapaibacterium sp.]
MKKQTENKGKFTSKPLSQNEDIEEEISEIEQPSEEIETRREDEPTEEIQEIAEVPAEPKKNGVPDQPSTLLVNKIYRLKKEIEEKTRNLGRSKSTLAKWQAEDEEKLKNLVEKFEFDRIQKIIEYRETGSLEAKNILIDFYQKQIEKLSAEKEEQEENGNHGDFSDLYKEYLKTRKERFDKNMASLKKNYLDSTAEKRDVAIPKLEDTIMKLKEELATAEQEAEKYQKA